VAASIAHICSVSMKFTRTDGEPYWKWLYAIPLLHQLQSQDGITHDHMSFDPSAPNWGTEGLDKRSLAEFIEHVQDKRYVYMNVLTVITF